MGEDRLISFKTYIYDPQAKACGSFVVVNYIYNEKINHHGIGAYATAVNTNNHTATVSRNRC